MAPEMLNKNEYGKVNKAKRSIFLHVTFNQPVDIWSLGIIMYQLLNEGCKHPFYDPAVDNLDSYLKKVMTTQLAPLSNRSE